MGAVLTWLLSQMTSFESPLKDRLEGGGRVLGVETLPHRITHNPPSLGEDGFVLILLRCYCYSLALMYFCVLYRLREGLVRLRLYLLRPKGDGDYQDTHIP